MGKSQEHFINWSTMKDVIQFALTLLKKSQTTFFIMFGAFCWTLQKLRNEYCFQNAPNKSFRTIVLLIISFVTYWTCLIKRQTMEIVQADWLSDELDAISSQVKDSNEECDSAELQLVLYRNPSDNGEDDHATCSLVLRFAYARIICNILVSYALDTVILYATE